MHDHAMMIGPPLQQRLACLGDASRYRMVVALASGERCVSELAAAVGLSQSCTTRHLQALQAAGLVHRIRYGKRVMVGLCRDEPELGQLLDWVLSRARDGRSGGGDGRNGRRGKMRAKRSQVREPTRLVRRSAAVRPPTDELDGSAPSSVGADGAAATVTDHVRPPTADPPPARPHPTDPSPDRVAEPLRHRVGTDTA
ncbi:MAG: ArsR/SmtB family transcription factor, partial [Candidatus Eisenbacteria bacterium]